MDVSCGAQEGDLPKPLLILCDLFALLSSFSLCQLLYNKHLCVPAGYLGMSPLAFAAQVAKVGKQAVLI